MKEKIRRGTKTEKGKRSDSNCCKTGLFTNLRGEKRGLVKPSGARRSRMQLKEDRGKRNLRGTGYN